MRCTYPGTQTLPALKGSASSEATNEPPGPRPAKLARAHSIALAIGFGLIALGHPTDGRATPAGADREAVLALQTPAPSGRVVVKFREESGLRVSPDGVLAAPDVFGSVLAAARVDDLLQNYAPSFDLTRHFSRTAEEIESERTLAETLGGGRLPDLNTYGRLEPNAGWTRAQLLGIVARLLADPAVENAFLEPIAVPAALGFDAFTGTFDPQESDRMRSNAAASEGRPSHLLPATPDYTASQGYLDPAPTGVDAEGAWLTTGGRGAGVKVVDIEGAWLFSHEDLPDPFFTAGGAINDQSWRNHGTAVLGEIRGTANGLGVTGIASDAEVGGCSISELSVADAINTAASSLDPGDIFLIELHAPGPNANGSGQFGYVCMEFWQDNFDAIQIASALGRICCEAAGNGEQDFDSPVYGQLFDRNYRDSGAIICGASNGSSLDPAGFSNYGARVDLHGWGYDVVTTAYGDLQGGPETQWYTSFFSGTSSASPIVVGSVASLQGLVLANLGVKLDATLARELLVATGTPQTGSRHIGPRPRITAAWALAQNGIGSVEGVVTEFGVGDPLEGISVTLPGSGSRAATNTAGQFSLPLLVGDYTLVFSSPFFVTTELPVTITAGGTANGDIALERRPTVALGGTVRSVDSGMTLAGVRVTPLDDWLGAATTGLNGTWSIPGAPVGSTYDLAFDNLPGYGADFASLTVPAGVAGASEQTGVDGSGGGADTGVATLDVQLAPATQNFEADNGSFTSSALWSWGTPGAGGPNAGFSGSRCWGVGMTGNYPDNQSGTLTSPAFDFSGASELRLSFHYWSDTEVCFDGANVEILTGGNWVVIDPLAGYQCGYLGGLDYEDGWSGATDEWVGAVFDLADYIGPNVRFRLVFGSDGGVNGAGFWVDEITFDTGDATTSVDPGVMMPSASGFVRATPNPFVDRVSLRVDVPAAGPAEIDIFDAVGRRVRSLFRGQLSAGEHTVTWDGRGDRELSLSDGVYFARLRVGGEHIASHRIVLAR